MTEKVPHKHAAIIKAWSDGATIQLKIRGHSEWKDWCNNLGQAPTFSPAIEYRVKPEPLEWQQERDAYAAGKTIQWRFHCRNDISDWEDCVEDNGFGPPEWESRDEGHEYRIKPESVEKYANVYDLCIGSMSTKDVWYHNKDAPKYAGALKLTFEDGHLVKAEII